MTVKDIVINPVATEPLIITGKWQWSNQTNQPSGDRQVRTDTGNWIACTVVAISNNDNTGTDRSADLALLKNGDFVNLTDSTNSANMVKFMVTGAVPQVGYMALSVLQLQQIGVSPTAGTILDVGLQIAITGNASKITMELLPGEVNPITPEIAEDLVNLIATALQTVSHLVSQADFAVHMQAGPIIRYTFEIRPTTIGEEFPPSG